MIKVKVEGTEISANRIAFKSTKGKKLSNKSRSLSIGLYYTADEGLPTEGMDITVLEDTTVKFGGTIKTVTLVPLSGQQGDEAKVLCKITSDGYNSIPDRRTVSAYYTSTTSGAIVSSMITAYLIDEGITEGTIDTGATIDTYNGVYRSVREILDDMAEASGYLWNINDAKELDFIAPTTVVTSSDTITETDGDHFGFKPKRSIAQFRNKQFVEGGTDSDGNIVRATAEDSADIATRAIAEGNSGVYGHILRDANIQTTTDAQTVADELLARYLTPSQVTVKSYREFTEGTIIKVTYPKYDIATDTNYLITQKEFKRESDRWVYFYKLEARNIIDYSSKPKDNGVDFFRTIAKPSQIINQGGGASGKETTIHNFTNTALEHSSSGDAVMVGGNVLFSASTRVAFMFEMKCSRIDYDNKVILKAKVNGVEHRNSTHYVIGEVGGVYHEENLTFVGTLDAVEDGIQQVQITVQGENSSNFEVDINDARLTIILYDGTADNIPDWVPTASDTWDDSFSKPEIFDISANPLAYPVTSGDYIYAIGDEAGSSDFYILRANVNTQEWIKESPKLPEYLSTDPTYVKYPVVVGEYIFMYTYYSDASTDKRQHLRYHIPTKAFSFVTEPGMTWTNPKPKLDGTGYYFTNGVNLCEYVVATDSFNMDFITPNDYGVTVSTDWGMVGTYNGKYYCGTGSGGSPRYAVLEWDGATTFTALTGGTILAWTPLYAVMAGDKMYITHTYTLPHQNPHSYITWTYGDSAFDFSTMLAGLDTTVSLKEATSVGGVIYATIGSSGNDGLFRYHI